MTSPSETGGTLLPFLQQLRGNHVDMELKNSSIVSGEITFVDANMNTYLKNVKIVSKKVDPVEEEVYMVRGSSIRYVILPETLNLHDCLKRAAERAPAKGGKKLKKAKLEE
ncbi:small nuclear ribonucleoprotein D1 [Angomonas deanei]|uniref:LSM domain containing protein, putative n=1 Tax=Angomonas deanei TaxID=59799 RepID=S9UE84_9TRYP|nr:small nuclear ribonucleoprotein D1 [Angomonas deanei]EPY40407.1 small nuclear ribonucleoprotein D1 [Angomonas deanei]EPY42301.1 small nuclear ribonucleoprotein D1 [Angomonas deanei]CAD2218429.1 LSM domain containing protein, putative [Angomonas deanei]|eukprot:EPY27243.1 small nuclear ribonucleoprotein D1 [Angomonas deanei]